MNDCQRLSVREAAAAMGASEMFVRRGLQQNKFPWGTAVKTSSHWTYWISKPLFVKMTGIQIDDEKPERG